MKLIFGSGCVDTPYCKGVNLLWALHIGPAATTLLYQRSHKRNQ